MFSTQSLPVENILLHQAAYNGNINEVRLLLNVKTDINIKDKKGFTALHFAVYSGHLDVVKLLISKKLIFMQELLKAVQFYTLLLQLKAKL